MTSLNDQAAALQTTITDMLGDMCAVVSMDPATARPTPGKVAVVINPPEITFEGWQYRDPAWTLLVIAGTPSTTVDALPLLLDALDRLQARRLNMHKATPVSFSLAGAGTLGGYEITLNNLEFD